MGVSNFRYHVIVFLQFIHQAGAIVLAAAAEQSRSLTVGVAVPGLAGLAMLLPATALRCPAPRYLLLQALPGLGLAAAATASSLLHSSPYAHLAQHLARGAAVLLLLPAPPPGGRDQAGGVAGGRNPVYRSHQAEVSFKQLTDSNQSSVDDMAVLRGEPGRLRDRREDSMHQL